MSRRTIICVLSLLACLGACADPVRHAPPRTVRPDPFPRETVDPAFRAAEQELAAIAADVRHGLQQRLEADEPLTPQFIVLLSDWSSRVFVHRWMAATSAADRDEAGKLYWQQAADVYRSTGLLSGGVPIAEYALGEAEMMLAELGVRLPSTDAGAKPTRSGRPLAEIAHAAWDVIQAGSNEGEPFTAEWVDLVCEVSRELWLAESLAESRREVAKPATDRHVQRLTELTNRLRSVDIPGGPAPLNAIRYYVAEAKLVGSRAWRDSENTPVMVDAARDQVEWLWKRKEAVDPPEPQFVHQLCAWSERLMWAEQGSPEEAVRLAAVPNHRRRMGELLAEMKKRVDNPGDVSRIQVSMVEYFVLKAQTEPVGVRFRM